MIGSQIEKVTPLLDGHSASFTNTAVQRLAVNSLVVYDSILGR